MTNYKVNGEAAKVRNIACMCVFMCACAWVFLLRRESLWGFKVVCVFVSDLSLE